MFICCCRDSVVIFLLCHSIPFLFLTNFFSALCTFGKWEQNCIIIMIDVTVQIYIQIMAALQTMTDNRSQRAKHCWPIRRVSNNNKNNNNWEWLCKTRHCEMLLLLMIEVKIAGCLCFSPDAFGAAWTAHFDSSTSTSATTNNDRFTAQPLSSKPASTTSTGMAVSLCLCHLLYCCADHLQSLNCWGAAVLCPTHCVLWD